MANDATPLWRQIINLVIMATMVILIFFYGVFMGPRFGSDEEVIRRYHIMMYQNPAMWSLSWLGVPTQQNPNDVWITQEIIVERKPDYIIETGTASGGSSTIWAMIQREVNPRGRVITIDIEDQKKGQVFPPGIAGRVDYLIGSSVDDKIVETVRRKVHGMTALVILDSNHHKAHVLREIQLYSELVNVGSYLIVQDTNISGHPVPLVGHVGDGPMEAVEEFLAANRQFEPDLGREKLLFTMHPHGYLKRVR